MAVNKVVKIDGSVIIDLSTDTVTSSAHIMAPYIGHLADGTQVVGTGQSGGGSTRTTIVPEQTANYTERYNQINYVAPLVAGEVYIYTIDGVETQSMAFDNYGTVAIGSPETSIGFEYGNGTMFLSIADSSLRTTHTVKVEQESSGGGGSGGSSATLITKTITENGTYNASSDNADGYSIVTVNVPSSGTSSWTKVAETSYQVSTTSTTAATVDTWATGHSELWTSDKIVYVRIRDTAGKRNGYFYGADTFFLNMYPANNSSSTSNSSGNVISTFWAYASQGAYVCRYGYGTTGYGIYPDCFYNNGRIRIRQRYSGSYSLTIDGTYKVEVYLLDPAGGIPIFG